MSSNNAFLIFPVHLFDRYDALKQYKTIYIVEEPRYFTDFAFHRLKLAYHRATMKKYHDDCKKKGLSVKYVEFHQISDDWYSRLPHTKLECFQPFDHTLEKKLSGIVTILPSPNFLLDPQYLTGSDRPPTFMNFYKSQRLRLDILVKDGKPIGDQWSFDKENRNKVPKTLQIPSAPANLPDNPYIVEARKYVQTRFPKNKGSMDHFIYPISSDEARQWLDEFLDKFLNDFGPYQDAIVEGRYFLWHSVLSPMMNVGLLTDEHVVSRTLRYQNKVRLESLEGFLRQIIGWRNYVLTYYIRYGKQVYESNHLEMKNRLTASLYQKLWSGTTGLPPVDDAIHGIVQYAYAHHIQRLMVLGNFLLLIRLHPKDVYKLFMEWTIDAYDWVMVPNVFSMSQYADGGLMMTRPYFSSSAYILKMSNFPKGEWCDVWNDLYYHFVSTYKSQLSKNYSTASIVRHLQQKSTQARQTLNRNAQEWIRQLFR